MKKFFSVVVALTMLFALCVPVFAGNAVDALTDEDAKLFAQAVLDFGGNLKEDMVLEGAISSAAQVVPAKHLTDADRCAEIASLAAAALVEDNILPAAKQAMFEEKATSALITIYNEKDLGISTFDPSDVVDNIADGFSDNDLAGLFDTMRNTVSDLSDRLSEVFRDSGNGGSTTPGGDDNNSTPGADDTYGGQEPTGDTAVYAVAGVAAVAAVALVLTKKKSK